MKIVVCVDESKASELALKNSVEFANNNNSELILLHSLNYEINNNNEDIIRESTTDAISRSENLIDRLTNKANELSTSELNIDSVIVGNENSDSIQPIIDYVNNEDIEQIFIGHRALEQKHEKLYGSFAKKMISKSPVPVVVTTTNGSD